MDQRTAWQQEEEQGTGTGTGKRWVASSETGRPGDQQEPWAVGTARAPRAAETATEAQHTAADVTDGADGTTGGAAPPSVQEQEAPGTHDDMERALVLAPPPLDSRSEASRVDLAIGAWLHAKFQRSRSVKTHAAYTAILRDFRAALLLEGLDLDAADPRRCRADLARRVARTEHADGAQRSTAESVAATVPPETVDELAAGRAADIALAAQAYAARPAQSRSGSRLVAPTTANLRLATLSSFYTYALRHDLLRGPHPIARVERRKVEAYAAARPLHYEDLRVRLAAIDRRTDAGLRDYALLLLGLSTGRRVSELAAMRRTHLTIRKRSVTIEWPRTKGGKRLHDELPRGGVRGAAADALVAWLIRLDELMEDDAFSSRTSRSSAATALPGSAPLVAAAATVPQATATTATATLPIAPYRATPATERPLWISLARNGTAGHPLTTRAIAQLCEKHLGVSTVHTLRHTFARALEDVGAKVSEIQAALGHADLGTTGRYLARMRQGENRHLSRLGALYGVQPEQPAQGEAAGEGEGQGRQDRCENPKI